MMKLRVLIPLLILFSCSSADVNVAEENLVALMDDIESNSDICFQEVSVAYKADSICIIHAIREQDDLRQCEEYVMYITPNGDDIFFTIDLDHQPSILTQFHVARKKYKMTDQQYELSVKKACVAYSNSNLSF